MYFVVFNTDKPGALPTREATRPAHRVHLREHKHKVKLHHAGPTLTDDGKMNGTLLIVEADDIAEVRAFVADDPYSKAGIFASVDIRPWNWTTGVPDGR
jgi:uncharacterized protein YciI